MGSGRFIVLLLVPIALGAFLVRTVLFYGLRHRLPRVAAAVDRWWAWVPLAVVVVLFAFVHPVLGVVAAIGCYAFLTSSRATGSPLRPRR